MFILYGEKRFGWGILELTKKLARKNKDDFNLNLNAIITGWMNTKIGCTQIEVFSC